MGWLRLVGSLKLHVSLAREPYKRNDILQKRPIILLSLLIEATPYPKRIASIISFFLSRFPPYFSSLFPSRHIHDISLGYVSYPKKIASIIPVFLPLLFPYFMFLFPSHDISLGYVSYPERIASIISLFLSRFPPYFLSPFPSFPLIISL